jgi:hypothetical protein
MKELGVKPRIEPKDVTVLETKKESGTLSKEQTSLDKYF